MAVTYSDVVIANMALGHIDIGQTITDLTDSNHRAQACNQWLSISREEILERFDWPLITKKITLDLLATEDDDVDWEYPYRYPVGCLCVRRIVAGSGIPQSEAIPFALGQGSDGNRVIWTNEEDAAAEVSYWFDNPGLWPSYLAKAISWNLAANICGPLGKGKHRSKCDMKLKEALAEAAGMAKKEQSHNPRPVPGYIAARS